MMALTAGRFVDVKEVPEFESQWTAIVENSAKGWIWNALPTHKFRISTLLAKNELDRDASFFLIRNSKVIGLMPLVLRRILQGQEGGLEASYRELSLPWPLAAPEEDVSEIEGLLLDEAERRAREAGAGKISIMFAPIGAAMESAASEFTKQLGPRRYLDASYRSHVVAIGPETLSGVRERYRRNVRRALPSYKLRIMSGGDIDDRLAATYMDLHIKDAGGFHRPIETYYSQMDIIRRGLGFLVVASAKGSGAIVGMLMVMLYKNAAYDASVAVDPAHQPANISHLLKWKAIEHLLSIGADEYELGPIATPANHLSQPSNKNYGISFFKDGWARGATKTIFVAEKFLDRRSLRAFWDDRFEALCSYEGL
jgi:GNAT superfamily N-acetyltransferase